MKAATRKKRDKSIRRRVEPSSSVPRKWQAFCQIDENNVELFSIIVMKIAAKQTEKQIVDTHRNVAGLAPCTHEDADIRTLLRMEDAVNPGYT